MNCPDCNMDFVYTTYIRTMKRNEKSHRSKQTWTSIGRHCINCGYTAVDLDTANRRAIMARRMNRDKQIPMKLNEREEQAT